MGISKGMNLEEIQKLGNFKPFKNSSYIYDSKNLIDGHPDFNDFTVILTPNTGVCKFEAFSKTIETNSFGTELQEKYNYLLTALTQKYGKAKGYDFVKSGSIWKEPQDWMMGLYRKERTLATYWTTPEINNLPDSLKALKLETTALSSTKGFITIGYEFDNAPECLNEINNKKNSKL